MDDVGTPERRELPPRPPVSDAVCSENALLFHRDKKFNVWIITSELIDRQRERGKGWSPRASFHWVTDLLSPPVSAERGAKEKRRERERERENEKKIEEKKGQILRFNDRLIIFSKMEVCFEHLWTIIEQLSFAYFVGKKKHESIF